MKFVTIKNNFIKYIKLFRGLYKDRETPVISKILLWAGIGYLVLPIDLIPDFIPVIGQLDDLIIVSTLFFLAAIFIPKPLYQKHYGVHKLKPHHLWCGRNLLI